MGYGAKGYHLVEHTKDKTKAQELAKKYRKAGWASVHIQRGRTYPSSDWYYSIYVKGRKRK